MTLLAPDTSALLSMPIRIPRVHAVQFYETDGFLADSVATFIADGLLHAVVKNRNFLACNRSGLLVVATRYDVHHHAARGVCVWSYTGLAHDGK